MVGKYWKQETHIGKSRKKKTLEIKHNATSTKKEYSGPRGDHSVYIVKQQGRLQRRLWQLLICRLTWLMQNAPSLKTSLPSLAVADMQLDRQKSAGQKKTRTGVSDEQKEGSQRLFDQVEEARELVMDAGLLKQKRPN